MLDMFKDLWDAMTPEQQEGICWIALKGDRRIGEGSDNEFLHLAIACVDCVAKCRSTNFQEYQDQVIEMCKGIGQGLCEGGEEYYFNKTFNIE